MTKDPISRSEYEQTKLILMREIKEVKKDINSIRIDIAKLPEQLIEKFNEKYVSKEAFKPVQKIVYGLVGAVLIGIIGAILALLIK